jgi:beta-N-acetylhexosaminidase
MTRHGPLSTRVTRRAFLAATGRGLTLTMLLQGCGRAGEQPAPSGVVASTPPQPATHAPEGAPQVTVEPTAIPATATMTEDVSLDVKIGQMLMVGFRGLHATDDLPMIAELRDYGPGGVVLFDYDVPTSTPLRNIESPDQVRGLIAGLQAASPVPLLVAVDQEGGRVARLKEARGFPPSISARELGAANDVERTRQAAATIAQTLRDLGFNLNFAPVVDLDINPANPIIGGIERSFSADPAVVVEQAGAFIRAHHEQGVMCTLKHFPGHGSSAADSHLGLVDVTATWSQVELEPYRALIASGDADAVMTAHVFNATLDPEYPATLSKPTIDGILREQLGYDGVVFCDDIQMGAIREQYGYETAVERAILAGVDMLTIGNNIVFEEGIGARTFAIIRRAVEEGRIDATRIDQAYRRIQALKRRAGIVG